MLETAIRILLGPMWSCFLISFIVPWQTVIKNTFRSLLFVLVTSEHATKLAHAYQLDSWIIFLQNYFFYLIWSWCFVLWSLRNPTRLALCEWGHVLCHFKQNQGSYPVKGAQAWSDWGHVHSESWVLHIRVIVMYESDAVCVSVVCFAGIVWKAVNSLVF